MELLNSYTSSLKYVFEEDSIPLHVYARTVEEAQHIIHESTDVLISIDLIEEDEFIDSISQAMINHLGVEEFITWQIEFLKRFYYSSSNIKFIFD